MSAGEGRFKLLVLTLCLGTPFAKLCFALAIQRQRGRPETEFRGQQSQTEFGNEGNEGNKDNAKEAADALRVLFLQRLHVKENVSVHGPGVTSV